MLARQSTVNRSTVKAQAIDIADGFVVAPSDQKSDAHRRKGPGAKAGRRQPAVRKKSPDKFFRPGAGARYPGGRPPFNPDLGHGDRISDFEKSPLGDRKSNLPPGSKGLGCGTEQTHKKGQG